ncbi:amidase [Nocardioides sp. L-11A]|uniref:amidase n=1 Tax=Nocardioides sp. L-11A TaxID=3043848 RepID=UPI00249C5DFD|nr:amidase family protein [Nocardioides sp. L-11A]
MTTGEELCFTSAHELAARIRRRELSPVELMDAVLERVERIDPEIVAFCAVDHDRARKAAVAAERKVLGDEPLGPLHGVPVSVKDLIFTKDLPTVGGSKLYAGFTPDEDDVVVERVRRAGGIVLGKTNVPDFGYGPTFDPVFGTTRNPWDLDRSPAGSSGGSAAAVAAGLGPVSLGSDGGGSIRVPASFCGVYGLNPSFGRVPLYPGTRDTRYPGFSGWESLERIGPLTRTVADAALLLDVLKGPDPRDRHSLPDAGERYREDLETDLAGLRIGWTLDWGGHARVDAEVAALVEGATRVFADLGAIVEVACPDIADPAPTFGAIMALDADLHAMRELVARYPAGEAPPRLAALLEPERSFLDASSGVAARKDLYNAFWRYFERYDLLLTPAAPVAAFPLHLAGPTEIGGAPVTDPMPLAQFTAPISLAGNPCASIPCGWTRSGLPVGLQIVGNHLDDRRVLQASRAFEIAKPWAQHRPRVPEGTRRARRP